MSDTSLSELSLMEAQNLHQSGRLPEAARAYHDFLRTNPRHHEALSALAMIYFQAQQYDKAQYLLGEAVRIDPYDINGLCFRGLALMKTNRHAAAIECFDRAVEIKPDFIEGYANRATALLEMGRFEDALAAFDKVLAIEPGHPITWNNRGNTLIALNRVEEAIKCYDIALELMPGFAEATNNRRQALDALLGAWSPGSNNGNNWEIANSVYGKGVLLMREGRFQEAVLAFDEALEIKSDFVDALSNRATSLSELYRYEDALDGFDRALALDPEHAISWNNRANVLVKMKHFEDAVTSYDKALALAPTFLEARDNRLNALFELKRGNRCPPPYMRGLFDDFSSHYDETMLQKLQYRAHTHLRQLAERVLPRLTPPWRILDLGCGTGLVGEVFKDMAAGGRLDGIDIAPRMIEAARARGIYDELILGDLETVLHTAGSSYELILAADTMIYLGDLAPAFSGVAQRLEPDGFYIFAVEYAPDGEWQQTPANRFRHSLRYLKTEAERAGLAFVEATECTLRTEAGTPVAGLAVALRKPPV
jgi:predicted TPR repeat methyltransferase